MWAMLVPEPELKKVAQKVETTILALQVVVVDAQQRQRETLQECILLAVTALLLRVCFVVGAVELDCEQRMKESVLGRGNPGVP